MIMAVRLIGLEFPGILSKQIGLMFADLDPKTSGDVGSNKLPTTMGP